MKVSPARSAAFDILFRVETDRAFTSVLLPAYEERLEANDRGLCHELVLGVLRRQIYLDRMIERWSGSKRLDAAVRIALRLGAYQLLFLDKVPAYSAINESVNLVQRAKKTSAKGIVNAILRRLSENGPVAFDFVDDVERVCVETSHPRWLIERWIEDFGALDAEKIASANNHPPRLTFRGTVKSDRARWLEDWETGQLANGSYVTDAMTSDLREMADSGEIYFQDEASQLVAECAASLGRNGRFLDVCAAPGGKTTLVAASQGADADQAQIIAGDLHDTRVAHLRATCVRQGAKIAIAQYDAEAYLPFTERLFDAVLVDAPCSGTGTIRHNPEIRYFLDQSDFAELSTKQRTILKNASKLVSSRGSLIYSTCSIQRSENEEVCESFLMENSEFRKVAPPVPGRLLTSEGFARTFPHRDRTDGFFLAVFERSDQG